MVVRHIIPVVGVNVVNLLQHVHQAHLIIVGCMIVVMGIVVQMVQFNLVILVVVVAAVVQVVHLAHQEVVVLLLQVHRLVHHPAVALLRLVEQ